ncbi:acyltransferase [Pontibacter korlensis]|uniref:acyltransferase family protein n=1 Tax=Pontibacter korlensis TaxID=400092 RepID=UPI000699176B|nr:acyltransferase [Pontibacter korlensis]
MIYNINVLIFAKNIAMKRLELLDYGRFFAATFVVLFHYTLNGFTSGKITSITYSEEIINFTKYGYLGVELFFMISGFVIFYSAKNRTASQFAVSRTARLYPAFWFAVLFTTTAALFWGGPLMSVTLPQFIANFTMAPRLIGFNPVDGVYWTLFLELEFYLLVFMFIFLGLQHRLNTLFLLWPFAIIGASLAGLGEVPYLGGMFTYFAAGAIFAIAREKRTVEVIVPLLVAFVYCVYYSSGQAAYLTRDKGVEYSALVIGLIISLFFLFFVALISKRGTELKLPKSTLLGGLTYPVYLIHNHFGYMVISQYATEKNKAFVYTVTFAIVVAVAYLMHYVIELKYGKTWTSLAWYVIGRPIEAINYHLSNKVTMLLKTIRARRG